MYAYTCLCTYVHNMYVSMFLELECVIMHGGTYKCIDGFICILYEWIDECI